MRIVLQKSFRKRLEKLTPKLRAKVEATVLRFSKNPFDPILENHPLKGVMLDVGTHPQVYKS